MGYALTSVKAAILHMMESQVANPRRPDLESLLAQIPRKARHKSESHSRGTSLQLPCAWGRVRVSKRKYTYRQAQPITITSL